MHPDSTPSSMSNRLSIMPMAIAFVALVCVSLIAISGSGVWEERKAALAQSEVVNNNFARALAQHADDKLKEADTLLTGLVERLEVDGMQGANLPRLHRLLMDSVANTPQLHGVFVYDEHGSWVVNSQPVLLTHFNNADRAYFIHHRDNPAREAFIGEPIRSRSTGDWIITLSRRIAHADGSFAGVALATLTMDHFTAYYTSFDIGLRGAIALALADGTLLARYPFDEAVIGKSMEEEPLFRENVAQAARGTVMQDDANGTPQLRSFRHLDNYPLVAIVTQSRDDILAGWRKRAWRHGGAMLLLTGGIALVGFHLIRQVQLRLSTARELSVARDALQTANFALEKLASEDGLTGLANRRRFDSALDVECARAIRNAQSLALILIDLDHFKEYNDLYGHVAGDDCLKTVARGLERAGRGRAGDVVARYGGEEFAILLPGTDSAGALVVAERIRKEIRDLELAHEGTPAGMVTISAGIYAAEPVSAGLRPRDFVGAADAALYRAKADGRNRVCALDVDELPETTA